jgi:16S rRNA A1518/A1519 N6-dimethyltransferase RsmA/KsgA/DIM1 with predicted DNA glycosylase/AP lyase activity
LIKEISEDFVVIEKDELMKEVLEELGVKVVWGDVLEVEIKEEKTLIVGNLPYYITSPILRKFFGKGNISSDALMKRPYQQQ